MNEPLPQNARELIEEQLRAGKKIEAIKLYREHTGLGLKEAKDAVEAMEAGIQLPEPVPPEEFAEAERKKRPAVEKGCLVVIAIMALATAAGIAVATLVL